MYAVTVTPKITMKSNNSKGQFICELEAKNENNQILRKEIAGSLDFTTAARTELAAVAEGISALKTKCAVTVKTKSAYIARALESDSPEWWETHGWRGRSGQTIKSVDLWSKILEAKRKHGHIIVVSAE